MLSPELQNLDLEKFMREALAEAEAAGQAGELPIGAVVVLDGKIMRAVVLAMRNSGTRSGRLN